MRERFESLAKPELQKSFLEQLLQNRYAIIEGQELVECIERKRVLDAQLFQRSDLETYRAASINDAGYQPEGKEYATSGKMPDQKRMWQTFREPGIGTAAINDYPKNKWPDIPGFKEATLTLYESYEAMAFRVLDQLEQELKLPTNTLIDLAKGGNSMLRTNYYPSKDQLVPQEYSPSRNMAHTDINLITLMYTPTAGGLEVFTEERGWEDARAPQKSVIVMTGKLLLALTNGVVRPAWHRVAEGEGERFSMPFFVHPKPTDIIQPFPQFMAVNSADLPPTLTAVEFLAAIRGDTQGLRDWVKRHSDVPPERRYTR